MTNTTVSCVRGCGTRSAGGTYLCMGIGPGGMLTVEDLILDPMKIWPGEWQRGFKILPDPRGWNNVGIFVGELFYASLWDFVQETKMFGISRKVPPTFPFDQLSPGKSCMVFIHKKGYPKFNSCDVSLETPSPDCKVGYSDVLGWHKTGEKETFCTFAHQHFAGLIHNVQCDNNRHFEINMPSFSYSGVMPAIEKGIKVDWEIAAFMIAPISHVEMPYKENKLVKEKANRIGYEVIKTDW